MKTIFHNWFRSKTKIRLVIVTAIALLLIGWTCDGDFSKMINSLCISVVAGVVCWIIVETIPSYHLRLAYKNYLSSTYKQTRRAIVGIVIRHADLDHLSPEQQNHLLEELENPVRFREFFKENTESGPWYRSVKNWNLATINDIDFHFAELVHAIESTLDNYPSVDFDSTLQLRQLCRNLRSHYSLADFKADPIKYESEYLVWPMMANFSLISGNVNEDPIQKAINQL